MCVCVAVRGEYRDLITGNELGYVVLSGNQLTVSATVHLLGNLVSTHILFPTHAIYVGVLTPSPREENHKLTSTYYLQVQI